MEALYYATEPLRTLRQVRRVLEPGGTFYCAVNYYEESVHSHEWQGNISVEMTRWDRGEYHEAFREAGLYVAEQDNIPDRETEISPGGRVPDGGLRHTGGDGRALPRARHPADGGRGPRIAGRDGRARWRPTATDRGRRREPSATRPPPRPAMI